MAQTLYQPLRSSSTQIRLLSIAQGRDAEPLICHLSVVSLVDKPPYTALSYIWGSSKETTPVTINGYSVGVAKNLYSLLLQCRRWTASPNEPEIRVAPSVFWADAICINQQDNDEKSHQVRLMGSIYSQALRVISWLGLDEAGHLTLSMRAITAVGGDESEREFLDLAQANPWLLEEDVPSEVPPNRAWLSLKTLFEDPYWQRVWILQEIVLAREDTLTMWAGEASIPFAQLLRFVQLVSACFQTVASKPDFFPSAIWEWLTRNVATMDGIAWGIDYMKSSRKSLVQKGDLATAPGQSSKPDNGALITLRFLATDPRDKIFALHNICNTYIAPDYGKSTGQVYTEFAKEFIMRAPNLKILKLAGIEYLGHNPNNLPSWVPDWQAISEQHTTGSLVVFGDMGASASSGVFPILEGQDRVTIRDDYTFCSTGCILDTVETKESHMSPTSPELREFARKYAWSSDAPSYPTGIPRIQALLRTLTLNGQPTLMADQGMPDIDPASVGGQCLLLLSLFVVSEPGEETTLETFRSVFESLGIPEAGQFRAFLERTLPGEEIGEVWNNDEGAVQRLHSSSFTAAAFTQQLLKSCILFETSKGYLGFATSAIENEDIISILPNCSFPVVLRKHGSQFQFVGACFVLGIMRGEAAELLKNGSASLQEIELV